MITFGIVGCGRIGRMHARNIKGTSRASLLSCYDAVSEAAAACAAELGIQQAKTADEILHEPSIRAIFIASSTDTHVELITRAVKAGKAVLCEKPVDLDIARVDACWCEIAPLSPRVMIAFNRRFDPSFRSLRGRVAAGEIGKIEQVVITSRDPAPPPPGYISRSGGLFRDMTIHDFDMARYLAGPIVEVQALGANLIDPEIGASGDIDSAMVIMRAASGALVHINNTRRCVYGYDQRIEVFGATGMLQAQNQHPTTVESWGARGTRISDPVQDFFIARYADAYRAEIDHFVECMESGAEFLSGYQEGREALRIANAALQSLETRKSVALDP